MFREAPDLKPQTVRVLDGHRERIRRMRRAAAIGAGQPILTAALLFLVAAFSTDGVRPSTWIAAVCLGATSALVIVMHRGYARRVTLETLEAILDCEGMEKLGDDVRSDAIRAGLDLPPGR